MFCKAKIFFVYSNGFMEKIFILLDLVIDYEVVYKR